MRSNKPVLETTAQYHDKHGQLWCVQTYYPRGKRNGNDRYWIATINKVGTTETIVCADVWALDRELAKLKAGQIPLV